MVNSKILLVESQDDVRASLADALGARYDVVAVDCAEKALTACHTAGPFGAAIAEQALPGASGIELLRRLDEDWPETVGILLAGTDPEAAHLALNEAAVFRVLSEPGDLEALCSAIDAALERHAGIERGERISEELFFGKESLETLTTLLEERIERQAVVARRLQCFAVDLNATTSLQGIAALAAAVASDVLRGRGVHVQLWDDGEGSVGVEATCGPEMSARMHRVPVRTCESTVGEISVDRSAADGEELDDTERALVDSIASSAAVAAHNELRRRERDRAQQATILALARLAEKRDQEVGKHLERVAAYCELVAEGLRADGRHGDTITDAFVEDLVRSSPLHDIGKVGIPDAILLKPGKLTPEEWEIMKTHAEIGALTLEGVTNEFSCQGFLAMGRDIAWCHHEKWDGSGYPRGLAGEAIPLSARILALADVYDALTTVRPYKEAWPHAEAVDWIRSGTGSHFDPDVAAAFLARAEQADAIRARLADAPDETSGIGPQYAVRT